MYLYEGTFLIIRLMRYNFLLITSLCLFFIGFSSCTEDNEVVSVDNNGVSTRAERGFFIYPTVSEIMSQQVVKDQMDAAWEKMKSSASKDARYEYGFYIYKKQPDGEYYVGNIIQGNKVQGCEGTNASISLGIPTSNIDVCAFFHCHTTLHYCPSSTSRATGPSQSDINFSKDQELPGILRDYSDKEIQGGHDINDPYTDKNFGIIQKPKKPY